MRRRANIDRCDPTEAGLTYLLGQSLPLSKLIRVESLERPGCFVVLITLKWWTRLTLGWHHRRAREQAHELIGRHKAVGTEALIEVVY